MPVYRIRRTAETYGQAVGILILDSRTPYVPGDACNASTYGYPVIFKTVPGLTTMKCLRGAPEFKDKIAEAARELERQGVRAISSNCGFMIQFQDVVRDAVKIPVGMSSLLQLPIIAETMEPSRPIGIVTADSSNLSVEFLERTGVMTQNRVFIRGLQDEREFGTAVFGKYGEKGSLDLDLVEEETVRAARRMVDEHPNMGAILLECAMLPPYSKAVQEATGLPVYDFVTLIDYVRSGTHQKAYSGGNLSATVR